jgi:hypothetical protein
VDGFSTTASIFHKIPFDGASIKALRGRVNAKIEADSLLTAESIWQLTAE